MLCGLSWPKGATLRVSRGTGAELLWRAKTGLKLKRLQDLPDGSWLARGGRGRQGPASPGGGVSIQRSERRDPDELSFKGGVEIVCQHRTGPVGAFSPCAAAKFDGGPDRAHRTHPRRASTRPDSRTLPEGEASVQVSNPQAWQNSRHGQTGPQRFDHLKQQ